MSEWWNKDISSQFSLPRSTDVQYKSFINFGLSKHDDIFNKQFYFYKPIINEFRFNDLIKINDSKEKEDIIKKYTNTIDNLKKSNKFDNKTLETKIKTYNTKMNKDINNINSVTKTLKIKICPNDNQIKVIDKWCTECTKVYDFCVNKFNTNKDYFEHMDRSDKIKIFNDLYGDKKLEVYDMLTDEVRIFFSNLKSCNTNLTNGNIKHFTIGHKDVTKSQSVFIPKTAIKYKGFYVSHLGKMKGMKNIKNLDLTTICDSRLTIDKSGNNNEYYLCVTYSEKQKEKRNRFRVVTLDPGEKIFQTYFSEEGYGNIGINIRNKILPIEQKIRRLQRILSNKINDRKEINGKKLCDHKLNMLKKKYKKNGKEFIKQKNFRDNTKLVNKRKIRNKIKKCYHKIKNIVKELHNKTALYLVRNYERILLPKFETQNMVKNKKFDKNYFNKLACEKGEEECKKEIKQVYKQRRLNGRVKFVLNNLSHYKFKLHLLNKCKEYGSELVEVTEEYTSKTCTCCGIQSQNYDKNRVKQCSCGFKIDRDINGARNIMIKNISKVVRSWATILPEERETVSVINEQFITNCNKK